VVFTYNIQRYLSWVFYLIVRWNTLSMPRCIPPFHIQHTGNVFGLSSNVNNNTSRGGYVLSNSEWSLGFDHKLVHVGFMVKKKVALRHVLIRALGLCLVSIIHQSSLLIFKSYTGCPRRNGQNFGRVFLMLKYTGMSQNTYIQGWTVTEIMAIEKCWLLGGSTFCTSVTPYSCTAHARQRDIVMQWPWRTLYSTVALTSQDNGQLRPA